MATHEDLAISGMGRGGGEGGGWWGCVFGWGRGEVANRRAEDSHAPFTGNQAPHLHPTFHPHLHAYHSADTPSPPTKLGTQLGVPISSESP